MYGILLQISIYVADEKMMNMLSNTPFLVISTALTLPAIFADQSFSQMQRLNLTLGNDDKSKIPQSSIISLIDWFLSRRPHYTRTRWTKEQKQKNAFIFLH
jgi:hypothetical protein